MALQDIVEQTVTGLGYDLVEIERSAGGLLRITIDLPWVAARCRGGAGAPADQFVTVEDCEKVTRQLQYALEVDGVEYKRLEVSSPGIDRPLRHEQDFERFVGHVVDVTLKAPIGAAAAGQVSANRKKFRGTLERVESAADGRRASGWQIVWSDAPVSQAGSKGEQEACRLRRCRRWVLRWIELREARLAPIVSFKGRGHSALTLESQAVRFDIEEVQESHGMNRELLMLVEAISREKNVERDVVFGRRGSGPGASHQEAVLG